MHPVFEGFGNHRMRARRNNISLSGAPLRIVNIGSCVAVWILLLDSVIFQCGAVHAESKENARWSIDFGAVSISEALNQLTEITGIKIFTETPLDHKISPKLYRNQSIDQILRDILRNVNYAVVWYYGEKGLDSVGVLVFDRDRGESPSNLPSVKRTGTMNRSPGFRQPHPRREANGQEKVLRRGVPDKRVERPSTELAGKDGSEADENDEESISSSMEVNDVSAIPSPDSQVQSTTTGSSNEGEGLTADQEKEDRESGPSTTPDEERGDEE